MDLSLTSEQLQLQDAFGSFFAKESPPERVRETEDSGFDGELWQRYVQTGGVEMGVPVEAGGSGASLLELALIAEQQGRTVASIPVAESFAAARLLASAGPAAADALQRALAGAPIALALRPAANGVARLVPWAPVADLVVALDGDALVVVEGEDRGTPLANLGSMPLADCSLQTGRTVIASGDVAVRLYEKAMDEWRVLISASLVGLSARALELGVDYAKSRHQFGVPIGAFQAIAHKLADVATWVDGARLLMMKAAWAADDGLPEASELAAMSFVFSSETAADTTGAALHVHGGYGFMLEYDIQLYFRRAKAWPLVYDDPQREYQRVADRAFGARA